MLEVKQITPSPNLIEWFKDRKKIDMDPSYQRRSKLWSEKNQRLLINTILNEFDVPKIYLADFNYTNTKLQENRRIYAVIDGKQRLETIFDFFSSNLNLDATPVFFEGKELNLKGFSYNDLQQKFPGLSRVFDRYKLTVMSVVTDNYEQIQEMFIRLNLNVSISGAEKRNAMPGPLPEIIRKLSVHDFFRSYATFPVNRGQDLNLSAKLLLLENAGDFTSTKKSNLDRFVREGKGKSPGDYKKEEDAVNDVLDQMKKVFVEKDDLLSRQVQVPIYYMFIKKHKRNLSRIRPFLVEFEKARRLVRKETNLRAKGRDIEVSDQELLEFNISLRSHDDKNRLIAMFNSLEKRFGEYLK